jgi:molybdopterin-guanine dinucleotide biosynthesis protein A
MSVSDLYIISAGIGSRIGLGLPKALVSIVDEPCLTATLRKIGNRFRKTFVITNKSVASQWETYFEELHTAHPELSESTVNVPIVSGLGDGHATLQGLIAAAEIDSELSEECVITWGDVYFSDAAIVDEVLTLARIGAGIVPAVFKDNPYVTLLVDEDMRCISSAFSKHGEIYPTGFHDQSVFRFDSIQLRESLRNLHNALWRRGQYLTAGGELSLLHSFHYLYNSANPIYVHETSHRTFSFNTAAEVAEVQREICGARRSVQISFQK